MKSEQSTIALSVEVNEAIYNCMQDFLANNPQWNRKMLIEASMSLFLMQNHQKIKPSDYQVCSQNYWHSVCLFPNRVDGYCQN